MMVSARFGVLTDEFHHWWCALKSPTMIVLSGRGIWWIHRSIVRSSLSGVCDFSLYRLIRRVAGVEGVERVRHWASGSLARSFLGVRAMCAAVLDRKVATRGLMCAGDGGRMDV